MALKIVSSLEKCFLDEDISAKFAFSRGSFLKNERFHFAACYSSDGFSEVTLKIDSPLAPYITVYRVEHVPVKMARSQWEVDGDYLRTSAGLYPELLVPMNDGHRLFMQKNLESLFFEVDTEENMPAGSYPVTLSLINLNGETVETETCELEIIDAVLPESEMIFTQWLYCDCLQTYYGTKAFDERHWEIMENYIRMAVKNGVNMMLTPVFTPPLDTAVGGERPTTQLVDVTVEQGNYRFGFEKLGRFVDLCDRLGVKYFEIAHLFTQWGAEHAPKIMATVDGEYRRIFGWETDAAGEEYAGFLREFIPALLDFMHSKNNADRRCYFHISDEPNDSQIEQYRKARSIVAPLLEGYKIIDALSSYEFYKCGIVPNPVCATNKITPFIENDVKNLWCYYCVSQAVSVSNRFMSMPSYRNRVIGTAFYKYNISGFLHWGYNFYNTRFSLASLNPFICTDGEYFAPSGDTFSVYPAPEGEPYPSIRLMVFYDALQDLRAFKFCESLYGRDFVMNLVEENQQITFFEYPRDISYLPNLREKINAAIKRHIG